MEILWKSIEKQHKKDKKILDFLDIFGRVQYTDNEQARMTKQLPNIVESGRKSLTMEKSYSTSGYLAIPFIISLGAASPLLRSGYPAISVILLVIIFAIGYALMRRAIVPYGGMLCTKYVVGGDSLARENMLNHKTDIYNITATTKCYKLKRPLKLLCLVFSDEPIASAKAVKQLRKSKKVFLMPVDDKARTILSGYLSAATELK